MRRLRSLTIVVLLLGVAIVGAAQNAQTAKLRGKVVDTTGAVMAATDVKAFQGTRIIKEIQTDNQGDFELDLPSGEYRVEVSAPDFTPFRQAVRVAPNMAPLSVTLALAVIEQIVEVKEDANAVAVSLDAGLGTTTLAGDQLQDLPDNEDDLATYLQQLASAKGGVEQAANFIIDGFNGGRLPPRDQIAQIIIEDNPFSAEGGGGGPRIRIITRPGSGDWRGGFQTSFRDESLNARSPNATNRPSSQQRTFSPQFQGPLIPGRVSMNFQGQSPETESEGNAIIARTPDGSIARGIVSPTTRREVNPRFQVFLNQRNTMNLNINYQTSKSTNRGGNYTLAERGSSSNGHQFSFQISENTTIGKVNNEI